MNFNLKDKNALIGGSSKGIGRAAAHELASLGANCTLVARSAELLAELVDPLPRIAGQHHDFIAADFDDPHDLRSKIIGLVSTRTIHILVNNSGGPPAGAILDAGPEAFETAFSRHLICSHLLTQLVAPGMKKEGYGRIINIISTSVKTPLDNLGVSNTTRGAVASWAKTMANELGGYGITVNNVLPGMTDTGRLRQLIEHRARQEEVPAETVVQQMEAAIPAGRFASPVEVGAAVAFLATPAAAYINGINLPVDGGRTPCL